MAARKKDQEPRRKEAAGKPPTQAEVEYIRSNHFRMIFAGGFSVGGTTTGDLFVTVFSEHLAFPTTDVLRAGPDGRLVGEPPAPPSVVALQRELEVGIIVHRDVARSLIEILHGQLNRIEALDAAARKTTAE